MGSGANAGVTLSPPQHPGDRMGWPATGGPSVLLAWRRAAQALAAQPARSKEWLGEGERRLPSRLH